MSTVVHQHGERYAEAIDAVAEAFQPQAELNRFVHSRGWNGLAWIWVWDREPQGPYRVSARLRVSLVPQPVDESALIEIGYSLSADELPAAGTGVTLGSRSFSAGGESSIPDQLLEWVGRGLGQALERVVAAEGLFADQAADLQRVRDSLTR